MPYPNPKDFTTKIKLSFFLYLFFGTCVFFFFFKCLELLQSFKRQAKIVVRWIFLYLYSKCRDRSVIWNSFFDKEQFSHLISFIPYKFKLIETLILNKQKNKKDLLWTLFLAFVIVIVCERLELYGNPNDFLFLWVFTKLIN